jgi:CPA2 family monovalent cation:H+ antiporter-2
LIFQDLCVVPMMLLIPILAAVDRSGTLDVVVVGRDLALAMGKAALFVVVALVAGRYVIPPVLRRVDAARSREVFLIAILVMCAGVAILTALVGLSLALGAFLAGVLLADGSYGQRAMSNVLPLRDLLTTMFFLSLGLLFDVRVIRDHPELVAGLFAAMFLGKGLIATLACLAMGFPSRVAWLAGVGLAQFGEFGFVLAREAQSTGLLRDDDARALLTAGLLTMFVTPLAMRIGPHVSAGARLLAPLERLLGARSVDDADDAGATALKGHVIIGGYGIGGQMLADALRQLHVPYVVLDLDAEAVRRAPATEPVYLGDVTSAEALEHAHVGDAAAVVLLLTDVAASRQSIATIRALVPHVPIVVRARRLAEHADLRALGASDVVSEELEGGIETLARVLRLRTTPTNQLSAIVRSAREAHGETARRIALPRNKKAEIDELADLKVESIAVPADSPALGKAIPTTEAVVIALRRGAELMEAPRDVPLATGDVLYVVGPRQAAYSLAALIDPRTGDPREAAAPVA